MRPDAPGLSIGVWAVLLFVWASLAVPAVALEAIETKITEKTQAYDLTIAYPQFGHPEIDAGLDAFAKERLAEFKGFVAERETGEQPYSADLGYEVLRNDEAVLSILFTYSHYTGGAHPNMFRTSFNYLMPDGARVFLPELIGHEGIKRVSELAIVDLLQRDISTRDSIEMGAGPYADNFETFVLLEDEIVIQFDPYEVAAYAAGPQEVRIALTKLADVMRADPRAPLPSFACAKAKTATERAICSDRVLAQLDRRTAEAYAMRLRLEALGDHAATVKAQQQSWLKQRDATCREQRDESLTRCLKEQYAGRLQTLLRFE